MHVAIEAKATPAVAAMLHYAEMGCGVAFGLGSSVSLVFGLGQKTASQQGILIGKTQQANKVYLYIVTDDHHHHINTIAYTTDKQHRPPRRPRSHHGLSSADSADPGPDGEVWMVLLFASIQVRVSRPCPPTQLIHPPLMHPHTYRGRAVTQRSTISACGSTWAGGATTRGYREG